METFNRAEQLSGPEITIEKGQEFSSSVFLQNLFSQEDPAHRRLVLKFYPELEQLDQTSVVRRLHSYLNRINAIFRNIFSVSG